MPWVEGVSYFIREFPPPVHVVHEIRLDLVQLRHLFVTITHFEIGNMR